MKPNHRVPRNRLRRIKLYSIPRPQVYCDTNNIDPGTLRKQPTDTTICQNGISDESLAKAGSRRIMTPHGERIVNPGARSDHPSTPRVEEATRRIEEFVEKEILSKSRLSKPLQPPSPAQPLPPRPVPQMPWIRAAVLNFLYKPRKPG